MLGLVGVGLDFLGLLVGSVAGFVGVLGGSGLLCRTLGFFAGLGLLSSTSSGSESDLTGIWYSGFFGGNCVLFEL